MRIQIKSLSRSDRFKCKFGIFNLMIRFEDFHLKIRRGSLSAINSLQFFPRLKSNYECLADIGEFCEFAETQILLGGEHPKNIIANTFGTSYEILLTQTNEDFIPTTKGPIIIGPCCVFGVRTTVLSGSTIGHNSTIAAGAVVNGSYLPNSVIAGTPARILKNRIAENDFDFLEKSQWWKGSYDWIIKSISEIQNGLTPRYPFQKYAYDDRFLVLRIGLEDARINTINIEGLLSGNDFLSAKAFPKKFSDYLEHFDGNGAVEIDTNIMSKCGI